MHKKLILSKALLSSYKEESKFWIDILQSYIINKFSLQKSNLTSIQNYIDDFFFNKVCDQDIFVKNQLHFKYIIDSNNFSISILDISKNCNEKETKI